jgi:hypothetical protein
MKTRLKHAAIVLAALVIVAQFLRPNRTNPPTDLQRTIHAQAGISSGLTAVLDRSCRDCHSHDTVWPWYTAVAPVSWAMAYAVKEGRKAVNFSEWKAYAPEQQQALLAQSCAAVSAGRMPGAYTLLHPATRLSSRDIEAVCAASREIRAQASTGR